MSKRLILAGVVLLASAVGAAAKSTSTTIVYGTLTGTCSATVTVFSDPSAGISRSVIAGLSAPHDVSGCPAYHGVGFIGRVTTAKGDVVQEAIIGAQPTDDTGTIGPMVTFTIQYPFQTGNQLTISDTVDGKSITYVDSTTYGVAP